MLFGRTVSVKHKASAGRGCPPDRSTLGRRCHVVMDCTSQGRLASHTDTLPLDSASCFPAMVYSGKGSKGCAPCRKRRTKCDLAVPSCSQCMRKGRPCHGYRTEIDRIFVHQTGIVKAKVRQSSRDLDGTDAPTDGSAMQLLARQPSRLAAVEDEAIHHFFAHYNEKFFAAEGQQSHGGFDYILPVYEKDLLSGGPVPEIVKASGLAALANMKASPELLTAAKATQVKVLRQLNDQLHDTRTALSDSSILTCIMLGIYENIACESPHATQAMTYHLNGAATLAKLRGPKQFSYGVGSGIFARMRGFLLAHSLQTREPLPKFIRNYLEDDEISQQDFDPEFYRLLARLCEVRSQHKTNGFIDEDMVNEAQSLMDEFAEWQPNISDWKANERPTPQPESLQSQNGEAYRYVWLATIWFFQRTARILASDMIIEWAREEVRGTPGSPASGRLDEAMEAQAELCEEVKDSTTYFLSVFKEAQSAMRTIGGYGLLWPLCVLSTASTSTAETMQWIERHSEMIADEFSVRQGKMMAEFMRNYT
ncbi:hypothetical protein EJ04DRAFT_578770 [Polyplosphaeria fusca]|uniref:Zn(2)-C6 fungal-type domain-containing protein n=1 Tax=Polyplosphaeria fusca TaxID=682080 RepID=A0A9P4V131_9PLEO|nr:hypothetical protein EJ04DRAFT_578770 [Polyplosphaeria fusca]